MQPAVDGSTLNLCSYALDPPPPFENDTNPTTFYAVKLFHIVLLAQIAISEYTERSDRSQYLRNR